jgi:hypothetical protein
MKTYFFHLRDGVDVLLDPDGRGLPTSRRRSPRPSRAQVDLGADALLGTIMLEQRIDVEDEPARSSTAAVRGRRASDRAPVPLAHRQDARDPRGTAHLLTDSP